MAYRAQNGKIQYRWELLPARLDPLIKMGYTRPNIVLDNIPWCFPEKASEPDYGKDFAFYALAEKYPEVDYFVNVRVDRKSTFKLGKFTEEVTVRADGIKLITD